MPGNQFGRLFNVSAFGEGHGPALGVVVAGCPAGVVWQQEMLHRFLARRSSSPNGDVEILSGVFDNITLGAPVALLLRNGEQGATVAPARHTVDSWREKYGHSDPREADVMAEREAKCRLLGGAVARMLVTQLYPDAQVIGFVSRVGLIGLNDSDCVDVAEALEGDPWQIDEFSVRCPNIEKNEQMELLLNGAVETGESFGGTAFLRIAGVPRGLGQPGFRNLKSELSAAYMGLAGATGVEIGWGFESAKSSGHEFHNSRQDYGGIRCGISTGEPITVKIAFRPPPRDPTDPCVVPRAIPVLEAMTWTVLADHILLTRTDSV